MTIATHPSHTELLDYTLGRLPASQSDEIAEHIDACSACGAELEQLDGEADTVVSQLLNTRPDSASADPALAAVMNFVKSVGREATVPSLVLGEGRGEGASPLLGKLREYELLAKLGEGGMGTVYKARHTKLDRIVALKVLTPERVNSPESVVRFEREMRAVGRLEHPNIVRAHDAGEFEGTHFLVMEYVAGCDLAELVKRRGPLGVAEACELIRQAALGLQYAHEHGLVHRDIKPSNLMLAVARRQLSVAAGHHAQVAPHGPLTTDHGQAIVKILDLGLALLQEPEQRAELTSSGQMMGTVDYMAPEQGQSSHTVDIRADIYSLGATLYKLLTGSTPFPAERYDTLMKKFVALATQPHAPAVSLRPDLPPGLCQLLDKLLAKDPQDRPQTPAAVANLLAPFAAGADLGSLLTDPTLALTPNLNPFPNCPLAPSPAPAADQFSDTDSHLSSSLTGTASDAIAPPPSAVGNALRGVPDAGDAPAKPAPSPLAPRGSEPGWRAHHKVSGEGSNRRTTWIALAAATLLLALAAATIIRINTPNGTLVLTVEDPNNVTVVIDGQTASVKLTPDGKALEISVDPGTHGLVVKTHDGVVLKTDGSFTMEAGGKKQLTAVLERDKPTNSALDPDRRAAEWVLSVGGKIRIKAGENEQDIETVTDLPAKFQLMVVNLYLRQFSNDELVRLAGLPNLREIHLEATQVEDAGLKQLKNLPSLSYLNLQGTAVTNTGLAQLGALPELVQLAIHDNSKVGDDGLVHLQGLKKLRQLDIRGTRVTDAGLAHLKPLKELKELMLLQTDISDAGLEHLHGLKKLTWLSVQQTKVSGAGLANLQKALPQCGIEWDGGVIEPTVVADPDRRAAEWVLSIGGAVQVNGQPKNIIAAQELPGGDLRLTGVTLPSKRKVTEEEFTVFKGCENLTLLALGFTPISDAGLANFKDCTKLTALHLAGGELTDAGLAQFKDCQQLNLLSLYNLKVSGAGLAHFRNCNNLEILDLRNTPVTAAGLAHFEGFKNLRQLNLRVTQTTDEGLAHFKDCEKLESVVLGNNPVTDTGLTQLTGLKVATLIELKQTKVTEAGVKKLAAALPQCKIEWDGGVIEPTSPPAPAALTAEQRQALEWVLANGGIIHVQVAGKLQFIRAGDRLPDGQFVLHSLETGNIKDPGGEALEKLRGVPPVRQNLNFYGAGAQLTDDALGKLVTVPGLATATDLTLLSTAVTDAGLVHVKRFPLRYLDCRKCPAVTDAGLEHLAACPKLVLLELQETKVTKAGVDKLAAALPLCRIAWDGGVIEPTAPADPERAVAEWVLVKGGTLFILAHDGQIQEPPSRDKLPGEPFSITKILLHDSDVTDADMQRLRLLARLESLVLQRTAIGDEGLSHIAQLSSLRGVSLGGCKRITGKGLALLEALANLENLHIRDAALGDGDLAPLPRFPRLRSLDLTGNPITAGGLERLGKIAGLEQLEIAHVSLSEANVGHVLALQKLKHLNAYEISEGALASLSDLPKLEVLDFAGSELTPAQLDSLARLPALRELTIRGLRSVSEIVGPLSELTELKQLNLPNAQIPEKDLTRLRTALPNCKIEWSPAEEK